MIRYIATGLHGFGPDDIIRTAVTGKQAGSRSPQDHGHGPVEDRKTQEGRTLTLGASSWCRSCSSLNA